MRRKVKKSIIAIGVGTAMTLSTMGCTSSQNDTESTSSSAAEESQTKDYSNSTVTGQVTAVADNTVNITIGELSTDENGGGGTPPDMGSSEDSSATPSAEDNSSDLLATPASEQNDSDLLATPSADQSSDDSSQTPPEKPDGDSDSSGSEGAAGDGQEAPQGDGQGMGGQQSFTAGTETLEITLEDSTPISIESMGQTSDGSIDDIAVNSILIIEFGDDMEIKSVTVKDLNAGGQGGGNFGGSGEVTNGTSANTITEDGTITDTTYTSTGDDENALRVDGAEVTLDGVTIEKTDGATSNTEDGDFYGQNAGLLALDGANLTIINATINTSAQNGNGVFSYGDTTVVTISDSVIRTTADNSGGIQTTGGGTTYANNLDVKTEGNSSAAIRSDRGGGTVVVDGGTYESNGTGSPAVYSTADITVSNAELTANNSEAVVVEGENSVALKDCTVVGNMTSSAGGENENIHNIMIYQSMSGDAEVGESSFTAEGGSITAKAGDMFYVTNTNCKINLTGVAMTLANNQLLTVEGNSSSRGWGTAGENGGQVEFTATDQTLDGDITVDDISTLDFTLSGSSVFTGTINIVDNEDSDTSVENNAVVTIDEGATWKLTGDCTVTSITNNGTIDYNGYTITLADGTVLK